MPGDKNLSTIVDGNGRGFVITASAKIGRIHKSGAIGKEFRDKRIGPPGVDG